MTDAATALSVCRQALAENDPMSGRAKIGLQMAVEVLEAERWRPIETAPRNQKVIAGYWNRLGNWRTITACYYAEGTLDSYDDTHRDFAPEGWYEESETHECLMPCDLAPTHWRPLPTPPTTPNEEPKG